MRVRILGTAAGGGLPQWNCGCDGCGRARASGRHRSQDCIAVTGDGSAWYLVNASADLRSQLLAYPEFAVPPGTRASPLRGILLTSAELDHTVGLLGLREAPALTVWATATVQRALPWSGLLGCYTTVQWPTVVPDEPFRLHGGLLVTPFAAGHKRPRYAAGPDSAQWTVAYRFADERTGRCLVYAPGLADWSPAFEAGIAGANVVLLDGTFATDGEFAADRPMGHLSIEDSLPFVRAQAGPRFLYTHLNNTNAYAYAAPASLAAAGAGIAHDGDLLIL